MILFGASGHAKVILEILEEAGHSSFILWDDAAKQPLWGIPVEQPDAQLFPEFPQMIVSIGVNRIRRKVAARFEGKVSFATAVHPKTAISKRVIVGEGTVIMAGVTVNADTQIGQHCIINTNASVDHDCVIGDFVHISPNSSLCGGVTIGEGSHIGAGSTVIPGIRIGRWCTIGAGAVIIRDVPDGTTVVGNPGKIIKTHKDFS